MKSKTLFSKYTRENFRRRLWVMAFLAVVLFLFLPVQAFMQLDGWTAVAGMSLSRLRDNFVSMLFLSNQTALTVLSFVIPVLGALVGIFDFAFLHSEKQVDFYYSFPVCRKKLFLGKLLVSYIYFVIPYTIMLALTLAVGWNWNLLTQAALIAALEIWFLTQVAYLLAYLTAAVAMILTGRLAVGVLGTAVLLGFGILLKVLCEGYAEKFFQTFLPAYGSAGLLYHLAPICYGAMAGQWLSDSFFAGQDTVWLFVLRLLAGVAAVAGLAFLGIFLMKKRSAESAGKSMAFPKTARVIHIVLSIAGGLWVGLFVQSIVYHRQNFWLILSTFCGTVLVYGIIQFIYTLDVRKTLAYRWQIVAAEAVALGIACIFCFDLFGYDTYLPGQDEVDSVAINLDNQYRYADIYADGQYQSQMQYRLDRMRLTDVSEAYSMLAQVVTEQNADDIYAESASISNIQVRYRMKNGMEINRGYTLSLDKYRTVFAKLYDKPEFRENTLSLLGKLGDETGRIALNYAGQEAVIFSEDSQKQKEFIDLYRKELKSLPGNVFTEEMPLAYLLISYGEKGQGEARMFLYPSCVKSLAYLKEMGWDITPLFEPERIKEIAVSDYRERIAEGTSSAVGHLVYEDTEPEDGEVTTIYREPSDIKAIAPALMGMEYESGWQDYRMDVYAQVTLVGPKGYDIVMDCHLDSKNFPQILE